MKNIGKLIAPAAIVRAARSLRQRRPAESLFGGDSELFRYHVMRASAYGEYGCGVSTLWVAQNTRVPIRAVDTSRYWIDQVQAKIGNRNQVELRHVDLGELGDWGRPLNYAFRRSIKDYTEAPWRGPHKPDVVLIDGRFRIACFIASVIHASPGTVILFDDYTDRPHYHVVEEYVNPINVSGRQAAFCVPPELPLRELQSEYERFLYVMD